MSDRNKSKKGDNQTNIQNQQEYTERSKLGLIQGSDVDQNYFNYILRKYSVNKERFLKDLLREQKILIDNNGLDTYQVSSFLNTLRKFYKKQDIEEVLKTKESNEQKPFEDSNDFLGCYCKQIKNQIDQFEPTGLANTLNGLAHLDVTREDLAATLEGEDKLQSELLKPICGRIKDILSGKVRNVRGFNLVNLANALNGLVTVFLYDEKTHGKTKEIVLDCIKSILLKVNKMDKSKIDDRAKYTFKKNLFYLENVLGLSLLKNNENLNSLKKLLRDDNIKSNKPHIKSGLEGKVEGFLKGKITGKEVPISCINNVINYSHPVDFVFEYKGRTIYCEVDGPTHFVNSNQTDEDKNPQTKIRDQINEFIISKKGKDCIYVTVPANKCEKELFFSCIDEKLELEKSIEELDKPNIASTADESKVTNKPNVTVWGKKTYCKSSSFSQLLKEQEQNSSQNIGLSGH